MTERSPLFRTRPPVTQTIGDLAAKFGREQLRLDPDPEQQWILDTIYAEQAPGVPVCFEVDVVAPRQNIKSSTFEIAALFDLFVLQVPLSVWTAHEFKTARKSFEDMKRRISRNPELDSRCTIRDSHGEERITLHSGESLEFHARSGGSGRGFTCDRLVLDEGLFLEPADMGAILPTLATIEGAQVRVGSSAGKLKSEVLRGIRESGRAGTDSGQGYVEYGATRRACGDPNCSHVPDTLGCALDDRELWWQANSALWVGRITEERIARFRKRMPPIEFAREFLSWWEDPPSLGGAFDTRLWLGLSDPGATRGELPVFALDVAPDHSTSSVAVAWRRADGYSHVMLAHHQRGTEGLVARCAGLLRDWGGRLVVEKTGTAAFLLPDLEQAVAVPRQFFVDACAHLDAGVTAGSIRHGNQPVLNAAVEAAGWHSSSTTGARVLTRKNPQVSPLVAGALALYSLVAAGPSRYEDRGLVTL